MNAVTAGIRRSRPLRCRASRRVLLLGLLGLAASCSGRDEPRDFDTPEAASEALIVAAERFDLDDLKRILGADGVDLVTSADPVHDRNQAAAFAAEARLRYRVVRDPSDTSVAHLEVGEDDWPVPIPLREDGGRWRFDSQAGREVVLLRRIGRNELDAIEVCRQFVDAEFEYASRKRDGATVNQYARRILSTPGRQDGLAWQEPGGSWGGPLGEEIARAIAEGYSVQATPFHGYYFKVLTGQGPRAPMGEMDFLIEDVMIGGFALAAAPSDYEVTGIMTFIVSHDGVVHEKDLGPNTLESFQAMDRYDPDSSWKRVDDGGE